jgi:hypothetical protein
LLSTGRYVSGNDSTIENDYSTNATGYWQLYRLPDPIGDFMRDPSGTKETSPSISAQSDHPLEKRMCKMGVAGKLDFDDAKPRKEAEEKGVIAELKEKSWTKANRFAAELREKAKKRDATGGEEAAEIGSE